MRLEFPPPTQPWSTNQERRMHHMERGRKVKDWKVATWSEVKKNRWRGDCPPGIVQVHIPFKDRRKRDPHNYCGTVLKAVIDGLVLAGIWLDDTPDFVGHREPVLYLGDMVIVEITPMIREDQDNGNTQER